MDLQLTNKLALVSGSTGGIGLAIATSLAAEGARVIINGRTVARVTEAIGKIRGKAPKALLEAFAGDLATEGAAEDVARPFSGDRDSGEQSWDFRTEAFCGNSR